ncbi:hypothetical protein V1506DRAFT_353551 [Lipomyces tetrasporus]
MTTSVKSVRDIEIGDYLYDAANRPALCIGVSQPATATPKKITYMEFDSRAKSSFKCTPGVRLSLAATNITPIPSMSIKAVVWFTRCDRTHTRQGDGDLHLDTDSSSVELDVTSAMRFAAIRKYCDNSCCGCKGFRRVGPRFATERQARLALSFFRGDHYHVIDPLIVRDGDKFNPNWRSMSEYAVRQSKTSKTLA